MLFPDYRPRRLRQSAGLRNMIRETHLTVNDLILPLFERVRQLLREYLVRQADQGVVRNLNPDIMAEAILGMFFSYALMQPLLAHCQTVDLPGEELIAQFVDIFTAGTLCEDGLVQD